MRAVRNFPWFSVAIAASSIFTFPSWVIASAAGFDPGQIQLSGFRYSGTGCPQGTVRAVLSPDASEISILFDQFDFRVGGVSPGAAQRSCQLELDLRKPKEWSYAIETADFRGFVHLDSGVQAQQSVEVRSGSGRLGLINLDFGSQRWQGPVTEDFDLRTVRPLQAPAALSCIEAQGSAKVKILTALQMSGGGNRAEGQFTVDSIDGSFVHHYRLRWETCQEELGRLLRRWRPHGK